VSRLAAIFGCAGTALTADEIAFFRDARPWGFILFGRNVETPEQVRALVDRMRDAIAEADAPVLIDQEGGRVQRLKAPHWPKYPAGRVYGSLAALGINVDCLPVLDVPEPGAHDVIGDRAYGEAPETVASLGRAAAEGLMAGGVLPVMKHIPGHGRAHADSHLSLPTVEAPLADLERDFAPFIANADLPLAMTSHVVYAAIDPDQPATTSKTVIGDIIRGRIGFDGLLMTDDLSMKALSGGFAERARDALAAGCDVILHCNGDPAEMRAVAEGASTLSVEAQRRAAAAMSRIAKGPESFDVEEGRARFAAACEGRWAA
jgi:beta-N-acetylhexosaminidase